MPAFTIDAGFPAGNMVLEEVAGDTVRLHPDLRGTEGNWFYWSFRVRGAAGRALNFVFTSQDPVGVRGPAVSLDEGLTWRWLGYPDGRVDAFRYTFPPDAASVQFSFGMNYTDRHWQRFCGRLAGHPAVREEIHGLSGKGRPVPRLHVGCLDSTPRLRIVLTARHHCCEMMADYALEGFVAGMLANRAAGHWYRSNVEAAILPFMDRDGVEDGDQGKNRRPRDHNRDYADASLYPETRELRAFATRWSQGRLIAMLDLHCPWIRGRFNEQLYLVGLPDQRVWAEQQRFGTVLERVARGPLPYRNADILPFGTDWNTGPGFGGGMSSANWFAALPGVRLATPIEIPYANCAGQEVNADSARTLGRDLAEALYRYLNVRS